ncbi:class I adenylate-forming enzyme family protein [Streptomyces sp. NPDC059582]|uniref:class I adenylate-forming enzyme family protein n=1 Tax=Streptomyces sp. NPDC059582 TaxID=3346875 RepID=UPI0036A2E2AF
MAAHLSTGPQASPATFTHYVAAVLASLERRGDETALRWRGAPVTAREFHRSITGAAAGLRRLGAGPGTTIGVLTEANSPVTLTARYAAHLLGATVVHIRSTNPGLLAAELPSAAQADVLRETGADLLLVDPPHADQGRAAADLLDRTIALAGFGECGAGITDIAAGPVAPQEGPVLAAPDRAVVTYTSGSTGRPKGICQSFAAWNGTVLAAYPALSDAGPVRFLVITPVSHSVGVILDIVIAAGGTVVLHAQFDPGEALRAIESERITGTYMAVPQLYALLDHPRLADTDVSSLRQLMYAGCPASPERLVQAVGAFGPALMQNYGTTEAGRISVLGPQDHQKPQLLSSAGRPFPEVELRICDPDSEQELARQLTGEVWVRSPNVMSGYLADPGLTARTVREGWLRTGDLGYRDEAGYLYLVGRLHDVIKSHATKIHPAAVEQALMSHQGVANAAVYRMRDADELEFVHAAVALRPGAACTSEQLRRHVGVRLTPLHAPVRIVRRGSLPLTESGKVDRRLLQALDASTPALDDV